MHNFIRKNGSDEPAQNLSELFSSKNRKLRIELFGSYLSKSFSPEAILTKVGSNINEISCQLQNLNLLKAELEKQIEEKNAKELQERLDKMSDDEARALMEKLRERLCQE